MMCAAVLCCAMTTTVFTSCGSEEEEEQQPQTDKQEILGIGARYIIKFSEQMTQYCDFTITYYANDNQLTTEKMVWTIKDSEATWQKDVSSINLPATFGVKVNAKVKEGVQLDGVRINEIHPTYKVLYVEGITKDGQKAWGNTVDLSAGVSTHGGSTGEKLPAYIEQWEKKGGVINMAYTFDKDGKQLGTGKIE